MIKFESYLANYGKSNKNVNAIIENYTGSVPIATLMSTHFWFGKRSLKWFAVAFLVIQPLKLCQLIAMVIQSKLNWPKLQISHPGLSKCEKICDTVQQTDKKTLLILKPKFLSFYITDFPDIIFPRKKTEKVFGFWASPGLKFKASFVVNFKTRKIDTVKWLI